jgi:dihydroorotate dehydrogenase (NAD+) catalytic subunit
MTPAKPTLAVEVAGITFPTPVMIASGCFSSPRELGRLVDLRKVGGIVTRSITLQPRRGYPTPRMAETDSGLLSAIGLQNPGVERFLEGLPALAKLGIPVIASVAGSTPEEFLHVASRIRSSEMVAGFELNLSAPNDDRQGRAFVCDPDQAAAVVASVTGVARLPVFAKLSADAADIVELTRACVHAGAHGVTLINTISGLAIDPATRRPKLAAVTGGLSGAAIKPLALLAVYRVARELPAVPILGVGGITRDTDAIEFLAAGAWAVQVGTAMFADPAAPVEIALGIARHLMDRELTSPEDLRGAAHTRVRARVDEDGNAAAGIAEVRP